MEALTAIEKLAGGWRDLPSREWGLLFTGLIMAWVLTELFVGRLGLHVGAVESDRGSALAVIASAGLAVMLASLASGLRWLPVGAVWLRWLGLAIMAAGLGLRVFSILWLGPMFTRFVQIVPGHRLITNGPYRFVRHPSYSGLLLFLAGMGLAFGSWLSLAVMATVPLVGVLYRVRVEEATLMAAFGEEYKAYMGRVGSLAPSFRGRLL